MRMKLRMYMDEGRIIVMESLFWMESNRRKRVVANERNRTIYGIKGSIWIP